LLSLYEADQEIDFKYINELEDLCSKLELFRIPPKKGSPAMLARFIRSVFSPAPYTVWRHYSREFSNRVKQLIETDQFHLVHCDMLSLSYAVQDRDGIKTTITDHDVSYLKCFRMAKGYANPLLRALLYLEAYKLKRLESKVFGQVDFGVAVSNTDKAHLQRLCPTASFEVIENGVDTDAFMPGTVRVDDNSLLWVGGFDQYPNREGIYYFLDAIYPLIKQCVRSVHLTIVGGNVTTKLRNVAAKDPSIDMTGYVDDLLPYLHRASAFIAPILIGSGTRLKLLEAMAAGKAIVATSIGCEGIEGINKVHFLIADSAKQFAAEVANVITDRRLSAYLGDNARALAVEKYDWKRIGERMDRIYRSYSR
jgi:polysaccharide biosynthesis protein PslH